MQKLDSLYHKTDCIDLENENPDQANGAKMNASTRKNEHLNIGK